MERARWMRPNPRTIFHHLSPLRNSSIIVHLSREHGLRTELEDMREESVHGSGNRMLLVLTVAKADEGVSGGVGQGDGDGFRRSCLCRRILSGVLELARDGPFDEPPQ